MNLLFNFYKRRESSRIRIETVLRCMGRHIKPYIKEENPVE